MASRPGQACGPLDFLHEASGACRPCSSICDPRRPHQHEPAICRDQCQVYSALEDIKAGRGDGGGAVRVLAYSGFALGLLALVAVLVCGGLLLFYVFRRPRKLIDILEARQARIVSVETPEMKVKMSNNNNRGVDIGRDSVCTVSASVSEAEIRMSAAPQQPMPPMSPVPVSVGGAMTLSPVPPPPPARHPSEDSTLDYAAYDNPALSPSSSPSPLPAGHGQAMEAVLEAVLDHSTLPGSVSISAPRLGARQFGGNGNVVNLGIGNGSVARMESSF